MKPGTGKETDQSLLTPTLTKTSGTPPDDEESTSAESVPETYRLRTSPSIHIETLVKKSLEWIKQQDAEFGPFTKGEELELTDYITKEIWKKVETLG